MMAKRPTKDVDAAIRRLRDNAGALICWRLCPGYGGSIESDILAVLALIDTLRRAS
jgi:hypothetical protein